jgi:hypothetical protein
MCILCVTVCNGMARFGMQWRMQDMDNRMKKFLWIVEESKCHESLVKWHLVES